MNLIRLGLVSVSLLALGACESSSRFGGFGSPELRISTPQPIQEPITAAPTPQVQSAPLGAPGAPGTPGALGPSGAPVGPMAGGVDPAGPRPGEPRGLNNPGLPGAPADIGGGGVPSSPVTPTPGAAPANPNDPNKTPPRVASRPDDKPAGAPTRSSLTGNWTASEATGGRCKVTLSSAPALDLYKASSSGCNSRELQRVTGWELRGSDIYLYESGGGIAARLQQTGATSYSGAAAKSGAPITLSK